jgi:hypothetical protein
MSMHMKDAFAGAVTVSIPIFALVAGAEVRSIRDRLRRPDEKLGDGTRRDG